MSYLPLKRQHLPDSSSDNEEEHGQRQQQQKPTINLDPKYNYFDDYD